MNIGIKRVYDPASPDDGYRILVDRLWPRGIRKADLVMDEWAKDVTPSTALRKAWHTGDIDDDTFYANYAQELDGSQALKDLANRIQHSSSPTVTLLVATKNVETSHAHVLVNALSELI